VSASPADLERATYAREQHLEAVKRVIAMMRDRLAEPITLSQMARVAYLSPFHFNRVFRLVTGVPPGRFLAALRMSEAKRLLLESQMNVTDICISVGYSSLGTFTTLFAQQVGVGPREFRRLGNVYGDRALADMIKDQSCGTGAGRVTVQIRLPAPGMLVMMGLFPRSLVLGRPVACKSADGPGQVELTGVPDGTFTLLAAAHPADATVSDVLVADSRPGQWVGAGEHPVTVERGLSGRPVRITLWPTAETNPPILTGIPLLSMMPPLPSAEALL
jgi:AraC family transcriptional regulator